MLVHCHQFWFSGKIYPLLFCIISRNPLTGHKIPGELNGLQWQHWHTAQVIDAPKGAVLTNPVSFVNLNPTSNLFKCHSFLYDWTTIYIISTVLPFITTRGPFILQCCRWSQSDGGGGWVCGPGWEGFGIQRVQGFPLVNLLSSYVV